MGRRAKPAKVKIKGKRSPAQKGPRADDGRVRNLEQHLAEARQREAEALKRESEALEQQKATADILRAISRCPTNLQPVLDTIASNAAVVCNALDAIVQLRDGELIRIVAHFGPIARSVPHTRVLARTFATGRAVLDREPFQIPDIEAPEADEFDQYRDAARQAGFRTLIAVPMLREGVAIGALTVRRREPLPFTDKQVSLLQTFADQAVIAIENVRLFNETKEALDQQTATADILRVISRSPCDIQPVFHAIVQSAVRLCGGLFGTVLRFDGEQLYLAAHHNLSPEGLQAYRAHYPIRVNLRQTVASGAILDRRVVQVIDSTDPGVPPRSAAMARATGFRGVVVVPMLRDGEPIGAINVARRERGPFSDRQVALLQTFADQAVIAIENARLFTELQEKNTALTEALDQQTATSEILRVISSSPTDIQPVFDTIVASAVRLLGAHSGALTRIAGEQIELAAITSTSDVADAALRARFPQPLSSAGPHARTTRDRAPLNIADAHTDPRLSEVVHAYARTRGYRSQVVVPMLRHEEAIGTISLTRGEPGGFTGDEIALLQTFADQAVIAIENVRLFKELQTSNCDLTDALSRQTATSEVLRVISRSQTDVQPVFAAILDCAVRLCKADLGAICRVDDGRLVLVEVNPSVPEPWAILHESYPRPVDTTSLIGRAALEAKVIHVPDTEDVSAPAHLTRVTRGLGFRSQLSVPILRDARPIGVLALNRRAPGPFSEPQIELVKTFADQAVIAIENARLLGELQTRTRELTRSVNELTALGDVSRALSSTLDLATVLTTIVSRAVQLSGLDGGVVFEYDEAAEEFVQRVATETGGALAEIRRNTRFRKGEGVLGRTAITLEPAQVPDITVPGAYESRLRDNLIASGIRAILAVPMVREGRLIGCLAVTRNEPGQFPAETIELLRTFATQSALAIQNARLFREIEEKSRQLEVASQHKSEFLANMSHELRTPLNAIIGFSEVLTERMFGELNEKQDEYLKDIHASGQHLLSLINDILDLSKIEAGRMELDLSDFDLPVTIDNALVLIRERAARRGIDLHRTVDERLGQVRADERKIRQVLLNLLSNAIKFTPEGGRIEVGAKPVNGSVEVSVSDTGVGIASEDQETVFEEFRQVGTADKKVEGTGLGLALSRKFIELHGGKIWVKSELGHGATFMFTVPVRSGE